MDPLYCLPRQMPAVDEGSAPKSQCSPLMWSHGCLRSQSWLYWRAQTLQHPQESVTRLMPGAQVGASLEHRQFVRQGSTWKTEPNTLLKLIPSPTSYFTKDHVTMQWPSDYKNRALILSRTPFLRGTQKYPS